MLCGGWQRTVEQSQLNGTLVEELLHQIFLNQDGSKEPDDLMGKPTMLVYPAANTLVERFKVAGSATILQSLTHWVFAS